MGLRTKIAANIVSTFCDLSRTHYLNFPSAFGIYKKQPSITTKTQKPKKKIMPLKQLDPFKTISK